MGQLYLTYKVTNRSIVNISTAHYYYYYYYYYYDDDCYYCYYYDHDHLGMQEMARSRTHTKIVNQKGEAPWE